MSVNKVILVGRLGKDPEVRALESGVKKASFSMATSEYYKDKEGKRVEQTEWHNIICWRRLAEFSEQFLTKGKLIYLEGRLRTRSWDDNGTKRYTTEIEATTITMLGSKDDGEKPVATKVEPTAQETYSVQDAAPGTVVDDLPF